MAKLCVYHIADKSRWLAQRDSGAYVPDEAAFEREGFIHMSTAEQVPAVLGRFYASTPAEDLLLLRIDDESELVQPWLKWEAPVHPTGQAHIAELEANNQKFPHLYAKLAPQAVVAVHQLERDASGSFIMPFDN